MIPPSVLLKRINLNQFNKELQPKPNQHQHQHQLITALFSTSVVILSLLRAWMINKKTSTPET